MAAKTQQRVRDMAQVFTRVPPPVYKRLVKRAERENRSVGQHVRHLIEQDTRPAEPSRTALPGSAPRSAQAERERRSAAARKAAATRKAREQHAEK